MEISIELAAFAAIGSIVFALKKWAFKGDFFNPGLIYALVNSLFLIVFAFGPYTYLGKIEPSYYLGYVVIIFAFVGGVAWGEKSKTKSNFKDILIKKKPLYILGILVIAPLLLQAALSGVLSGNLSLEEAARNNLERAASLQANREDVNLPSYISTNLFKSFTELTTAIFLANIVQKKGWSKSVFLGLWIFATIISSFAQNSRTILFMSILSLIIPLYTVEKSKFFTWFKEKDAFKTLFQKNFKRVTVVIVLIPLLVVIMTNARSSVKGTGNAVTKSRTEVLESAYLAKKKPWFYDTSRDLPPSLVDPISELAMYAGGTVASGGVISRLAIDTQQHTWGLRYFYIFHRVISQLGLDAGFSDLARGNYYKVSELAMKEMPIIKAGWFSDPGNLILDFGYIGGAIASLANGWLMGWMYSRFPENCPVLRSTVTSVLALAMLLSPAFNFFGGDLYRLITFGFLVYLVITRYRKNKKKPNYNKLTRT
jgi:hypothetical protein